jgi:hypothetical protein
MTFTAAVEGLKLAKTNFGFMGLRVAKSISAQYGGGHLTSSHGLKGEKNVHEKQALWMDYSGPLLPSPPRGSGAGGEGGREPPQPNPVPRSGGEGAADWEGVTWFDHPSNPNHPTSWHTRDDGWMSPAFNLREAHELTKPLMLRYALHVHSGGVNSEKAGELFKAFAASRPWVLTPAERPWRYALRRL